MKPTTKNPDDYISENLTYVIGCFTGVINNRKAELRTVDDKEDYERSIKYYMKDGGILRLNNICARTYYYKEPGGMQVDRTKKRIHDSAVYLAHKYPDLCTLNTKKKSGYTELNLRDRNNLYNNRNDNTNDENDYKNADVKKISLVYNNEYRAKHNYKENDDTPENIDRLDKNVVKKLINILNKMATHSSPTNDLNLNYNKNNKNNLINNLNNKNNNHNNLNHNKNNNNNINHNNNKNNNNLIFNNNNKNNNNKLNKYIDITGRIRSRKNNKKMANGMNNIDLNTSALMPIKLSRKKSLRLKKCNNANNV